MLPQTIAGHFNTLVIITATLLSPLPSHINPLIKPLPPVDKLLEVRWEDSPMAKAGRRESRRLDALAARQRAEKARLAKLAAQVQTQATAPVLKPQALSSEQCKAWMNEAGIKDQASAYQLIMRESGCNPNAVNASSGACGIGQQLPCGKWPHPWNDPVGGMIDMQHYVFATYGSWAAALNHSLANNWY